MPVATLKIETQVNTELDVKTLSLLQAVLMAVVIEKDKPALTPDKWTNEYLQQTLDTLRQTVDAQQLLDRLHDIQLAVEKVAKSLSEEVI